VIEFAPLFTLEVTHAYYGGRCADFEFIAPSATQRLLAGGRLLAKRRDGALTVLYEKNTVEIAGRTLQFGLKLLNPHFGNFSVLPLAPGEGLALYANGGADPTLLQAPVALLLDPANAEDAELLREGLFGVVEVRIDAAFYGAPAAFQIAFAARAETLRYYVVARGYTAPQFNQLDVTDVNPDAEPGRPIAFERLAASAFGPDELPAALIGGADARVALFRSQAPVARRERARKRIQLARNAEVIVAQLPQPGPAAATADLVIHLSK
jgi:hypothetical protein